MFYQVINLGQFPRSVRPDDADGAMGCHGNQNPRRHVIEGVGDPGSYPTQPIYDNITIVSLHMMLNGQRDPESLQHVEVPNPQCCGVGKPLSKVNSLYLTMFI